MKVVLDTNILDVHIGRSSQPMRALSTLGREQKITICIPHVVEREHRSHMQEEAHRVLSDASRALGALDSSLPGLDFQSEIQEIGKKLKTMRKGNFYLPLLDNWIADVGAEVIFPEYDQSREVVDAYFDGKKPFTQKKNKNDFPDALIWMLVKQTAVNDTVVFITNDSGFKGVDTDGLPIKLYSSLESFLQTNEIQDLLASAQETANLKKLREIHDQAASRINHLIDMKVREFLDNLENVSLGSYREPGIVENVGDAENLQIEMQDLEYYGEGKATVQINFDVNIGFEQDVPFDEYMLSVAAGEEVIDPTVFEDEHVTSRYLPISRELTFEFVGYVRLDFGEDLSNELSIEDLLNTLDNVEVDLESVEQV